MKIHALMENTAYSPEFKAEHGLSLYIEADGLKILFDTGQSSDFSINAELLGVDISKVDFAVLSHGHYDHGNGIPKFLELNSHAPVYISDFAFGEYYNAKDKYIGLYDSLKGNKRLVKAGDFLKINENISISSCREMKYVVPLDTAGLTEIVDGEKRPDRFLHEQYLSIREGNKSILISGCSHRGILNIMNAFKPDILIGGFHFMKQEIIDGKNITLDKSAHKLMEYDTEYYTCHCTGVEQYNYISSIMGERLNYLASGQVIEI